MAIEKAIFAYTKEQVPSVSDRVYALTAPSDALRPYITFSIVSNQFNHSIGGDSGLCLTRVQFSAFCTRYENVKEAVQELKSAYRNYAQGEDDPLLYMGSEQWVQTTLLDNETDGFEDDTNLFRTSLDVMVWHKE